MKKSFQVEETQYIAEILVFDLNRPGLKVSYLNTDFLQEHCPRATAIQEIDLAYPKMISNYHRAQACRLYSQKPCCLIIQQLGEKYLLALTVCPSVQNNFSSASEPGQSEPEEGRDTVSCLHQPKTQDKGGNACQGPAVPKAQIHSILVSLWSYKVSQSTKTLCQGKLSGWRNKI